jgi:hypothetical protein
VGSRGRCTRSTDRVELGLGAVAVAVAAGGLADRRDDGCQRLDGRAVGDAQFGHPPGGRQDAALDAAGTAINVSAVAASAGVDRSYNQPDLLAEVRRLRDEHRPGPTRRPAAERASEGSLQARLAAAHHEVARLRAENRELRRRLEEARRPVGCRPRPRLNAGRDQGAARRTRSN